MTASSFFILVTTHVTYLSPMLSLVITLLPNFHPLQVTASGFFNVTVDVHRDKRGTAYRQWQRSVDVAEAMLFDVEMVPLTAPYSPAHHLIPPYSPATFTSHRLAA